MKKEHNVKLVLIEFGIMDGDKHTFAFFQGREQLRVETCPNETLSHSETVDVLKEYFDD